MTLTLPAGVQINAPDPARLRDHPHAAARSRWSPSCTAPSNRVARNCSRRASSAPGASTPASGPTSCRDQQRSATATGRSRRCRRRCECRRVEITGPVEAQDDHQRLQLRRRLLHDRLRGFEHAELGQPDPGPDQPLTEAIRRTITFEQRAARRLQAQRQDRHAAGAAARLAPRRKARAGRRPARLRRHLRLRAVHVPQRQGTARARRRARTSICRRWRAISKRACGTTSSS